MARVRGLSRTRLKVIGLALVLLGAVGSAILGRGLPSDLTQADLSQLTLAVAVEAISWIGMPIYAWLLHTGMAQTRNRVRYGLRLLGLAVVSEVPYDLATSGVAWNMVSQNPVWGLVVCLVVLSALEYLRQRKSALSVVLGIVMCLAGVLWMFMLNVYLRFGLMAGGVIMLLLCLVFFFLDGRENTMMLVGTMVSTLALVFPAMGLAVIHYRNDRYGLTRVSQYAFYAAYPVCLLAVGIVGWTM